MREVFRSKIKLREAGRNLRIVSESSESDREFEKIMPKLEMMIAYLMSLHDEYEEN